MTAEEAIKEIRKLIPASPESGVDDRIRHIEEHGDPDGLGPEDVCDIIEKLYIEQWHAIDKIVMAVESAQQGAAAELLPDSFEDDRKFFESISVKGLR